MRGLKGKIRDQCLTGVKDRKGWKESDSGGRVGLRHPLGAVRLAQDLGDLCDPL